MTGKLRHALIYRAARAEGGSQLADARRLGRRGEWRAAARLPRRLPQLRHDLRAGLGPRTGARPEPRLRRCAAAHPPSARRPPRPADDPDRRRRDHGDDDRRLRIPRPLRLPRLPPRDDLVRPLDRRPRRRDSPHPRPFPLQRPPRLRRPPLRRPLPRRPDDRGQTPQSRLARPGPTGPRRPPPPRGLGLLARLPPLPLTGPEPAPTIRGRECTPRADGYSKTRPN